MEPSVWVNSRISPPFAVGENVMLATAYGGTPFSRMALLGLAGSAAATINAGINPVQQF
jgi:hypothetical protein